MSVQRCLRTLAVLLQSTLLFLLIILSAQAETQAKSQSLRLVSVAGSITEILYALELQDQLVGVDTTSRWPQAATQLPQVGYQRALSAEGILSLSPDRVLATADAGPPEVLQQLKDAGVDIEPFSRDYTFEGLFERIRFIGQTYDRKMQAEQLVTSIQADWDAADFLRQNADAPTVVFLLGTEAGAALAAGSQTSANAMLQLAGAVNPLATYTGYKPVNAEALIAAAPDYLVVVQHDADRAPDDVIQSVLDLPGVMLTPAGQGSNIIVMDALSFLGFGPRTGQSLKELVGLLYPVSSVQ